MSKQRFKSNTLQEAIRVVFSSLPSTRESLERELMEASILLLTRLGGQVVLRSFRQGQVFQDVVDEVAEALVEEKDSRTRTDMVELVILALLKVLCQ